MSLNTDGLHVITTRSAAAAAHYREGLSFVEGSSPRAHAELAAAVAADERFAIAWAALAVVLAEQGMAPESAVALVRAKVVVGRATRRERQQVEIVDLFLGGDAGRARALGAAHLQDFDGDVLIARLMSG